MAKVYFNSAGKELLIYVGHIKLGTKEPLDEGEKGE